ncbi:hypothetical protein TBR22_A32080 [Luteitalea sp. TBR-22]|uniref:hypothetical protein n=1 Tax=Luteitalea sp. TBR-22 TaxID=2802971 RepID=UPI001AF9104C|nr:hypothetical protein [Luteitalea sp. TBR-22]BCS33979.1 hypothetical protein TBR22_A32080 [Luteitalea sp. TBR-22]
MTAYRTRSNPAGAYWAQRHVGARAALNLRFGGIDDDIERIFLGLRGRELGLLLARYAERHGQSAAQYARATLPKWRTGAVKLSGQTAARLLDLVPPYLDFELRFKLIKKLRDARLQKLELYVTCTPEDWRAIVRPAVAQVIEHYRSQELPSDVRNTATWLADNDSKAAQQLLTRAAEEQAQIRTSLLEAEFQRMQAFVAAHEGRRVNVMHVIELPVGRVHVGLRSRRRPGLAGVWDAIADFF